MSTIGYTEEQNLAVLREALGLNRPGKAHSNYNHIAVDAPSLDFNACNRMVDQGLLIYRGTFAGPRKSRKHLFHATEAGIAYLNSRIPKPMPTPPPTREEIARILGQEPVFPSTDIVQGIQHFGLTRRQQIAAMVLHGMLSNPKLYTPNNEFPENNFKTAWAVADRFLAEEGPVKL